jgi:hypothetical protein
MACDSDANELNPESQACKANLSQEPWGETGRLQVKKL